MVEREFAALPGNASELSWIGGERYAYCDRATQKQKVIAALVAREWFTHEAPEWAQPLPLKFEDCTARFNGPNRACRRGRLVGIYGITLREMSWQLQYAKPFEVFCGGR